MSKFATQAVEAIKAREVVEQLVIQGVGQLDLFESQLIGTTYGSEFTSLLAYIEHLANGGNAGKKLVILKSSNGPKEYEFKGKHIRIYAIQLPGKKLIIYGGVKRAADSSDNIKAFRAIKEEYLNSLK